MALARQEEIDYGGKKIKPEGAGINPNPPVNPQTPLTPVTNNDSGNDTSYLDSLMAQLNAQQNRLKAAFKSRLNQSLRNNQQDWELNRNRIITNHLTV